MVPYYNTIYKIHAKTIVRSIYLHEKGDKGVANSSFSVIQVCKLPL